ncbi:MAG: transcriptional regulator, TetR family [Rhizobacter sp.]|nr:transcriptional regulator, TetR family [Rhizobacter sp.]
MARGRAAGYDQQLAQILSQAAALFAQRGYSDTSMNDVAQACGMSKPALYHYVRDKYQLLVEIAEGHVLRLQALVEGVGVGVDVGEADAASADERLRRLIDRFVEAYADSQNAHRVLTEDVKFLRDEDRERIHQVERRVVAAFADAIAGVRPELQPARIAKPAAMLLFGMINWMFMWLKPDGALTYRDMAPLVADLFFGGVHAMKVAPAEAHADAPPASKLRGTPGTQTAADARHSRADRNDPHTVQS